MIPNNLPKSQIIQNIIRAKIYDYFLKKIIIIIKNRTSLLTFEYNSILLSLKSFNNCFLVLLKILKNKNLLKNKKNLIFN